MRASDFDELLTMVARRRGWDVRRPAPGEPTRCLLVPNTSRGWPDPSMLPWTAVIRRQQRKKLPSLAIDVGKDAIWVVDPNTNALIASASVAQVSATPTNYIRGMAGAAGWVLSALAGSWGPSDTSPVLVGGRSWFATTDHWMSQKLAEFCISIFLARQGASAENS